jgi:Domain of unknown function (DUF5679)
LVLAGVRGTARAGARRRPPSQPLALTAKKPPRSELINIRVDSRHSTQNMLMGVADSNSPVKDPGPEGRCVCGQKVPIADAREITLPNGRAGWEGYCPECGAPLFAIRRGSRGSG